MKTIVNWLLRRLATQTVRRGSFVIPAEWERCEELRPDRLGLTQDIIEEEQSDWRPPPEAVADPWRPKNTLG